jgi:hypothetical protein
MTKREFCESHETIAYYSGLNGLEIKGIEYGIDDYMHCVSGAWSGKKTPHRLKIYNGEYVKLHGYKIRLDECIRTGV